MCFENLRSWEAAYDRDEKYAKNKGFIRLDLGHILQ